MLIFGLAGAALHLAYPALPWTAPLVLLQMMAGLAGAMGWLGSQTLVGQLMKGDPLYAGRLSFSLRIGAFVGPPLVGAAWDHLGPWGAFGFLAVWAAGAAAAAALVPVSGKKPDSGLRAGDLLPRRVDYVEAFRLLAVPAIALVIGITVLRHTAVSIQHSFYVVWLEEIGVSGTQIGILLSAWAVLGSISALMVGRLAQLAAEHWLVIATVTAQIVFISITPLLPNYGFLLVAMALYGGSMGISQPLMIGLMARSTRSAHQGKSAGLRATANQLAAAVMPVLMGGIVEVTGLEAGFYVVGCGLVAAMGGIAWAVARAPAFAAPRS